MAEAQTALQSIRTVMSVLGSSSILKALQTFQRDLAAMFKSVEHGMALGLIVEAKRDVLTILLMRGDERACYSFCRVLEAETTTVVIVLLIAVLHNLRSRCINYVLKSANWDPDNRVMGTSISCSSP
jgi:hypothetical protein